MQLVDHVGIGQEQAPFADAKPYRAVGECALEQRKACGANRCLDGARLAEQRPMQRVDLRIHRGTDEPIALECWDAACRGFSRLEVVFELA